MYNKDVVEKEYSGKSEEELRKIVWEMIKEINKLGLKSCASIGICSKELAKQLKDAGLNRFHHNINTHFLMF